VGRGIVSAAARGGPPGAGLKAFGGALAAVLGALSGVAGLPAPAGAAEIKLSDRPGCMFELNGLILPGDADAFHRLAEQHWEGFAPGYSDDNADIALCLDSPGGVFQEGHKISLEIHERAIATRVTSGAECLSACALVFMAGRVRGAENDGKRRILHVDGRLGLHAPYVKMDDTKMFSGEVVNAFVPDLTGMIADFIRHASFRSVFQDRPSISLGLLAEMLATPPDAMFMIDTVERAARWGVDLDGVRDRPAFAQADFAQLCENELAWIYDSAAANLAGEDLSYLRFQTDWKEMAFGATEFLEIFDDGLSTRACSVEVPTEPDAWVGLCLADGYTGVGLGDCDDPVEPYSIWVPWWHALAPDMPLGTLG